MENLGDFVEAFAPFLALAAMLAVLVLAINTLGRRFERHDDWLRALDARVGNLDKNRQATWAKQLARPFESAETERAPLVPPPLPPRAPTIDATDWRDDDLKTEDIMTRQTGRYPDPTKGPNDDDASS